MKNSLRACLVLLALTVVGSRVSHAGILKDILCDVDPKAKACGGAGPDAAPDPVPEIDPAMGAGALALLGGALMVIRSRRVQR
jgi:hypothetical protein